MSEIHNVHYHCQPNSRTVAVKALDSLSLSLSSQDEEFKPKDGFIIRFFLVEFVAIFKAWPDSKHRSGQPGLVCPVGFNTTNQRRGFHLESKVKPKQIPIGSVPAAHTIFSTSECVWESKTNNMQAVTDLIHGMFSSPPTFTFGAISAIVL